MDLNELFKRKSLFATRNVGNEKVLVPVKNNIANMTEIYTLNEVGCFIWDNIDGIKNEDDIINEITNEFDIDRETAKKDLNDFLEKFNNI
ncbi:MAG TPA: PqqD family protein [Bacteroidales bacterium]|nr:PqqD family protein [Bacteroidales bacterium]HPS18022.1 PqqD family protein [Bacteroidales bacterium]